MSTPYEFESQVGKSDKLSENDGEMFRQGEWLCHRAKADIVAHGADGTSVILAKKGGTVCDVYAPNFLNMPPLFPKSPIESTTK